MEWIKLWKDILTLHDDVCRVCGLCNAHLTERCCGAPKVLEPNVPKPHISDICAGMAPCERSRRAPRAHRNIPHTDIDDWADNARGAFLDKDCQPGLMAVVFTVQVFDDRIGELEFSGRCVAPL